MGRQFAVKNTRYVSFSGAYPVSKGSATRSKRDPQSLCAQRHAAIRAGRSHPFRSISAADNIGP
jgi:hypothetical protein